MNVFETLKYAGERLQIPMIIGSFGGGDIKILFANAPAAIIFGYSSTGTMTGLPVEALMPKAMSQDHRVWVQDYHRRAEGGMKRPGGIMDQWRNVNGVKSDGVEFPLSVNVADIKNNEERYFLAVFRDRTAEVALNKMIADERAAEISALMSSQEQTQKALQSAEDARELADRLRVEAEEAKKNAEEGVLKLQRLAGQISLLRQIFAGTLFLVVLLGALVVAQWSTGGSEDGLSMIKDVLLVMTGILGSAMASVFDSRNSNPTGGK